MEFKTSQGSISIYGSGRNLAKVNEFNQTSIDIIWFASKRAKNLRTYGHAKSQITGGLKLYKSIRRRGKFYTRAVRILFNGFRWILPTTGTGCSIQ